MSEVVVQMYHIPKNCLECPLNGQCRIFADWVCTLNSLTRKQYPRPFDKGCNFLAVLPENHGRLVDADALKVDYLAPSSTSSAPNFYYVSKANIDYAPTVVPAAEK